MGLFSILGKMTFGPLVEDEPPATVDDDDGASGNAEDDMDALLTKCPDRILYLAFSLFEILGKQNFIPNND